MFNKHRVNVTFLSGAGLVASASYSRTCAVFEPGAKHTFDEGVGK